MKQVWRVGYHYNGFETPIAVYATEAELVEYMRSELGFQYGYSAMTEDEVDAWKACRLKVYMA